MTDLITRLRSRHDIGLHYILTEAADALEAQQREIERLRGFALEVRELWAPTLPMRRSPARGCRFDWRVGRPVEKRGNVGVLQKRYCAVWLLCYSNHIDNATGETKWQRNK